MKPKPDKPANMALYRVSLNCKIGMDALSGKNVIPPGSTPLEYAVYCLLSAVEDLGKAMEGKG